MDKPNQQKIDGVLFPERKIVVDTREQRPWIFPPGTTTSYKLDQGDYSLQGLESWISIERKSLDDLAQSITRGRSRFQEECVRLRDTCAHAFIIVEGDVRDIANRNYASQANPSAILASLAAWSMRFGIHVIYSSDRAHAICYARNVLVHAERQFCEPTSEAVECQQDGNGNLAKNGRRLYQSSKLSKSSDSTPAAQTETAG